MINPLNPIQQTELKRCVRAGKLPSFNCESLAEIEKKGKGRNLDGWIGKRKGKEKMQSTFVSS